MQDYDITKATRYLRGGTNFDINDIMAKAFKLHKNNIRLELDESEVLQYRFLQGMKL